MRFSNDKYRRLDSSTTISQLLNFIFHSYDGWYLAALTILYLCWGILSAIQSAEILAVHPLVLCFYPALLMIVYIRQRLGTFATDKSPTFFSFMSLTALATVPVYIIFWR